jgi:ABC-type sugar transport system ATPase subunit
LSEGEIEAADAVAGTPATAVLEREPALRVRGLSKTFPGVKALDAVDLEVAPGTIHALLGQNGCGKSTLIKVLAGFHRPDPGARAWLDGEELALEGTTEDQGRALRFVHQDLGIINELDAIDNFSLALGYSRTRFGRVSQDRERARAAGLLERFGLDFDLSRPLGEASAVERTVVAIARALAGWERGEGVLVLDEPTASLPSAEVDRLFDVVREVRASGTAVLYVSHRLDEIFEIADRVTVLRGGVVVHECDVADITPDGLASQIAGADVGQHDRFLTQRRADAADDAVFRVRGLSSASLRGVDLDVRAGEVVGVAGLLGSGREDLPYAAAGAREARAWGTWTIDGQDFDALDVATALEHGVALVPGDRAGESIVRDFTVLENMSMAMLPRMTRRTALDQGRERREAQEWMRRLDVADRLIDQPISVLSGGNQQKVVLARWLWAEPKVMVLAEPTAGVDIGARQALYEVLREQAERGLAVLVCSSDVQDIVATCTRVLVLRDGVVVRELQEDQISTGAIVSAMEGTDA